MLGLIFSGAEHPQLLVSSLPQKIRPKVSQVWQPQISGHFQKHRPLWLAGVRGDIVGESDRPRIWSQDRSSNHLYGALIQVNRKTPINVHDAGSSPMCLSQHTLGAVGTFPLPSMDCATDSMRLA